MKAAIEADATSGRKKLYKNFIYNEFNLHMHLDILKNMERYVKKYISHILRYMKIYKYIQYIYDMS